MMAQRAEHRYCLRFNSCNFPQCPLSTVEKDPQMVGVGEEAGAPEIKVSLTYGLMFF